MRFGIVALGSQGDVHPLVALGAGLVGAGHRVRVAANDSYQALIRGQGLDYAPVAGDPQGSLTDTASQKNAYYKGHRALSRGRDMKRAPVDEIAQVARDCLQACQDADVIVSGVPGLPVAFHIAEKTGALLVRGFPYPTRLAGRFQRAKLAVFRQFYWFFLRGLTNTVRREVLGLPPLSWADPFRQLDEQHRPALFSFSTAVVPRPYDWGDWMHVTGYWFLPPSAWQPPADLLAFLEAGPAPVVVTFGSQHGPEAEAMTDLTLEALKQTNRRGVLVTGWGALRGSGANGDLFALEWAPFDWLFQRAAAVVHHGGAGTTALALRGGAPSVVVPFYRDQAFWGQRVRALGAGARPIPYRELTAERLASAIHEVLGDPDMRLRASAIGQRIAAEDGVGEAVRILENACAHSGKAVVGAGDGGR